MQQDSHLKAEDCAICKGGTPWSEKLAGAVAAIVHFMTASEADSAPMERGRNEKGETEDAALDEINNKAVKKVNPRIGIQWRAYFTHLL